ncbi:MAG: secretin N-terminal domain-containing protein, partial [Planctomycetota bacterium]
EALVTLIDAFDRPSAATQPTVVPASDVRLGVAERLPPILAQVTDPTRGDRATTAGDDAVPTPDATGDRPEDLTSILDRLRGDVSIESIDALGLLVLRGNEADVDAVLRVIGGIESMSVGATPEIHLRRLAHVSGESLAGLLNDVYAGVRGIERRSDRADAGVSFIPVVQPNAVVIVTPSRDLPSVLELIDELDAPLDPAAEVEVFRLKNANASSAVTVLQEFYAERGGLGARLRVATDPRTNTLIVQARPNDLAEIRRVVENLDSGLSASVSRLRLFALERAVASEVADFLNTAIDQVLDARSVGPSEPEPKAVILEFFADEGAELIRSGVLADVRVSADPRTNAVAVVAPERSMPLFEALIAKLDAVSAAAEENKVFQLHRAAAPSAAELLTTLFEQSGDSPAGVALPGGGDAGSVLLPLRFTVDVRTNSIIARGGRDALTIAEAILLRLDVGDARSRVDKVFRLKNAPAADIAEAINEFLESQFELTQIDPNLVSTVELLERDVIVVPEPVSNSLLISATPSYYDELEPLIKDLDAAPPQVIIQGLIV